jgi:HEPN superfamily AbiU2-like protein
MDKESYIPKMGERLGTQFCALWEQVVWLHIKWDNFAELFGTKPKRIELLNKSASSFFGLIQDVLWNDVLLHIGRLTDPPKWPRLTINNLPNLIPDVITRKAVDELLKTAMSKTEFCRAPRNQVIAHTNINLFTTEATMDLGSRLQMKGALAAIDDVLNHVETHYTGAPTAFEHTHTVGNAKSLLPILYDGLREQQARIDRLGRGKPVEFPPADL